MGGERGKEKVERGGGVNGINRVTHKGGNKYGHTAVFTVSGGLYSGRVITALRR